MTVLESGLWIVISGVVFGFFHSLTASQSCKLWVYKHGLQEPYYRLLYSIIGVFTTALWAWYYVHSLSDTALYQTDGVLWWLLVALQVFGGIIVLAAFQPIDGLVFLGLRKASADTDPFIVRGIYRMIRHPMYAGAMLIVLAMPEQSYNGLIFAVMICVYFIVGSRFEERRMLAAHPDYAAYQAQVSAFIPKLRR